MGPKRATRPGRAQDTPPTRGSTTRPHPGSRHPGVPAEEAETTPSAPDAPPLDHRKAAILKAVVAEYIDTAQPVGSAHITGNPGVEVSSATVRSEMAALERDGYLVQPHTSAGRIPTDKGYRFFVDHLGRPGTLGAQQRHEVRRFFAHVHGEVEDLLGRTSGLLADLTGCAAVVVGPSHESATILSVQLVGLSAGLGLAVAVLSDGAVEKCTVDLPDVPAEATDELLAPAAAHITAHVRGGTLSRPGLVPETHDGALNTVVRTGVDAIGRLGGHDEHDQVFVGGSSRMASAFDAVETVRSVLSILEQQLVVVELIEDILDRGLSVAIGAEHGFEPLAACALVVAPVEIEGEVAGTVGVLGPTRMHYPRALAAVRTVGQQLGERLGAGSATGPGTTTGAGPTVPARPGRARSGGGPRPRQPRQGTAGGR